MKDKDLTICSSDLIIMKNFQRLKWKSLSGQSMRHRHNSSAREYKSVYIIIDLLIR